MATTIPTAATMQVIRAPIAPRTAIAPTILPSTDGTTIPTKEGAGVATESAAPAVLRSRADLPTLVGGIYDNHSDRRRASHAPRGRGILRLSPTVVTIRRASQRHLLRPARIFGVVL